MVLKIKKYYFNYQNMTKDFIREIKNDVNNQYYRETLLNYATNRWKYNQSSSVGKVAELIRQCQPKTIKEWEDFYFQNAKQNKKNGEKITRGYIEDLGKKLYIKISEVVENELQQITEEECISFIYNLVINRTFDGYYTEITSIYEQLEKILCVKIKSAPDEFDRKYGVDFYIEIKENVYIGLQIKPVSGRNIDFYNVEGFHVKNHEKFTNKYKGKVFFIYSKTIDKKKQIQNIKVIDEIKQEIKRLNNG